MSAPAVRIEWTRTALQALQEVGSAAMRRKIVLKVDQLLRGDPRRIGKPLQGPLAGLYRVTHGRYRVIYDVADSHDGRRAVVCIRVRVLYVGMRKAGSKRDVYVRIARLLRQITG